MVTVTPNIFVMCEHINDEDILFRRIPPWWYVKEEDRVASAAFKDLETSVYWQKYTTPSEIVVDYKDFHVAALQAKIPRQESQEVRHDPTKEEYAHSLIVGKKTQRIAKVLAQNCTFVIKRI